MKKYPVLILILSYFLALGIGAVGMLYFVERKEPKIIIEPPTKVDVKPQSADFFLVEKTVFFTKLDTIGILKKQIGDLSLKLLQAKKIKYTVVESIKPVIPPSVVVAEDDEIGVILHPEANQVLRYWSKKNLALDDYSTGTVMALGPSLADSLGMEEVIIGYNQWYQERMLPKLEQEAGSDALINILAGAALATVGLVIIYGVTR